MPQEPENLTAISIATIAREKRLDTFPVVLAGNGLSPRHRDGDLLIVSTLKDPLPGDAAIIANPPGSQSVRAGFINADGDVTDKTGTYLPFGAHDLLGTVTETIPAKE